MRFGQMGYAQADSSICRVIGILVFIDKQERICYVLRAHGSLQL
jgi:hypothetical protein